VEKAYELLSSAWKNLAETIVVEQVVPLKGNDRFAYLINYRLKPLKSAEKLIRAQRVPLTSSSLYACLIKYCTNDGCRMTGLFTFRRVNGRWELTEESFVCGLK